jgi:hypothetical protein
MKADPIRKTAMEETADLQRESKAELARLRRLIADAARVAQEKGYSEDAFDALVDEWHQIDFETQLSNSCLGCGGPSNDECPYCEHRLGIPVRDDEHYVPY